MYDLYTTNFSTEISVADSFPLVFQFICQQKGGGRRKKLKVSWKEVVAVQQEEEVFEEGQDE